MQAISQVLRFALEAVAFASPALDAMHADLMSLQPAHLNPSQDDISLKQLIILKHIQCRYLPRAD